MGAGNGNPLINLARSRRDTTPMAAEACSRRRLVFCRRNRTGRCASARNELTVLMDGASSGLHFAATVDRGMFRVTSSRWRNGSSDSSSELPLASSSTLTSPRRGWGGACFVCLDFFTILEPSSRRIARDPDGPPVLVSCVVGADVFEWPRRVGGPSPDAPATECCVFSDGRPRRLLPSTPRSSGGPCSGTFASFCVSLTRFLDFGFFVTCVVAVSLSLLGWACLDASPGSRALGCLPLLRDVKVGGSDSGAALVCL